MLNPGLEIGQEINNARLHEIFGCGLQGGDFHTLLSGKKGAYRFHFSICSNAVIVFNFD